MLRHFENKVNFLSNNILGAVLVFEACTQSTWHFMEKYDYIQIYLLCGVTDILSAIYWLEIWSLDSMEKVESSKTIQFMILHGITYVFIGIHTYLDGIFIYHKLQNVLNNLLLKFYYW